MTHDLHIPSKGTTRDRFPRRNCLCIPKYKWDHYIGWKTGVTLLLTMSWICSTDKSDASGWKPAFSICWWICKSNVQSTEWHCKFSKSGHGERKKKVKPLKAWIQQLIKNMFSFLYNLGMISGTYSLILSIDYYVVMLAGASIFSELHKIVGWYLGFT